MALVGPSACIFSNLAELSAHDDAEERPLVQGLQPASPTNISPVPHLPSKKSKFLVINLNFHAIYAIVINFPV
jgi:hypothetical protein